jgi:hypothetical protein
MHKGVIVKKLLRASVLPSLIASACALFAAPAMALPALQLYIDGGTYDSSTETWVLSEAGSFSLWVIGDVEGTEGIYDVKLSAAVSSSESGTISLSSTTTSVVTDPSTPSAPVATSNFPSADGAVPVMGDGSALPTHGIYGAGTTFYEWAIGDFTLMDSPIGDFINTFPSSFPNMGQINVYDVTVSGYTAVHFDAYDHVYLNANHVKYVNAPFSHDGEVSPIPEPETYAMLLAGLGLMGFVARRRRKAGFGAI